MVKQTSEHGLHSGVLTSQLRASFVLLGRGVLVNDVINSHAREYIKISEVLDAFNSRIWAMDGHWISAVLLTLVLCAEAYPHHSECNLCA